MINLPNDTKIVLTLQMVLVFISAMSEVWPAFAFAATIGVVTPLWFIASRMVKDEDS